MLAGGLFQFVIMWCATKLASNIVVAKLPFSPWGFVSAISKRGMDPETPDRDIGIFFVLTLFQSAIRGVISKLMGERGGPRQ